MILTPSYVASDLKPGRHYDGGNLCLRVSKSGGKSWSFVWKANGTVNEVGLGSFTGKGGISVSLKQARLAADRIRIQIYDGVNPLASRKQARDAAKRDKLAAKFTFKVLMAEKIASLKNSESWKVKDGVCDQEIDWARSLTLHAAKLLDKPIAKVDTDAVVGVLKPIWSEIPETAERVRYRIQKVWDLGKAKGLVEGDNPARYDGHIEEHCGKRRSKSAKKKNGTAASHAALHYDLVPGFMGKLLPQKGMASKALALVALTAVRTDEARLAQWSEFDLDAGLWVIPADRMKASVEHIVPLSTSAIELLRSLPRVEGNPFVFFGKKEGTAIGPTALADKLCDPAKKGGMGYAGQATVHGMRSAFRDWVGDKTHFASEDAEHCLAHGLDATEGAYRRSTAVEKRRIIMQAWADYCEGVEKVAHLQVAA